MIICGPAGSGKSVLTGELSALIESYGAVVARVNFDPAAEYTPYDPDVDIRQYVMVRDLMKKGLGPNGAIIAAVDSMVNHVFDVRKVIEDINPDYVIVDTPGQIELFAYRHGGPFVFEALTYGYPTVVVFLMDALFFTSPANMVSVFLLASSVAMRFKKPQINVISKADLIPPERRREILEKLGEEGFLSSLSEEIQDHFTRSLATRLAEALYESGFVGEVIPVSVEDMESLSNLYAKITQMLSGGEEHKYYDITKSEDL
ncbi:MAG: ATP/GTP-binding protein [Acidilobaceae archaeon]